MQISEYVDQVCNQMRWKKARTRVADELAAHITDSRDAYISQGLSEKAATAAAISDTGDASALGAGFDRIHRPKPQWGMLAAVAGFLLLGLLSSIFVHDVGIASERVFWKVVWMVVGIALMFAAYFVDFTIFGKYPRAIFAGTAMTGFALAVYGFVRTPVVHWQLTTHLFQIITLLLPLGFVCCIFATKNKGLKGIAISAAGFIFLCIIAGRQFVFTAWLFHASVAGMAVLVAANLKGWFGASKIIGMVPICLFFAAMIILWQWNTMIRLSIAINPGQDPLGFGFMGVQIRQILSGAALLGKGSVTSQFLSPLSMHSDLLLTSIIYRFGWVPFAIIICGIAAFIVAGFTRCFKQKSHLGFFVSFAVMATFTIQAIMYLLFNLGFLFAVISLPLISPGSLTMVVNLLLVGFMLSVFRTGDATADKDFIAAKIQS